jgi:hypothetical protein
MYGHINVKFHNRNWRQISSERLEESAIDTRACLSISAAVKDAASYM